MNKIIIIYILTGLTSISLSQNNSLKDFKNIESICYCNTTQSTPDAIMKLDNNWEITLSLVTPKTTAQLDSAGIKYTYSQLKLLEQWSIISKSENEKYQTNIIVLDSIKTSELRKYSVKLSIKLTEIIRDDIIKLKNILKKIDREPNTYSIIFSYVLDGMVWDYLDTDSLLPNNEINVKKPFWAGEFWLLYPKRTFSCGTNSISDKGYSIKVNWSERAIPKMLPFVSRWDLLEKILNDLIAKDKVEDKESTEVFSAYNFFDKNGNFTVPVIVENNNNSIYKLSGEISAKVNSFLTANIDFSYLKKEFNFKNNSQSIIILYHEMLWDMLDILESEGLINKPKAFKDPENSKSSDISDLIIITKK